MLLRSLLKLAAQRMAIPTFMQVAHIWHSSDTFGTILGQYYYLIIYAILVIGLVIIEISIIEGLIEVPSKKNHYLLTGIYYGTLLLGVATNIYHYDHYYHHLKNPEFNYYMGLSLVVLLYLCFEAMLKILIDLRIKAKSPKQVNPSE